MLRELVVEGLGVIERAELELEGGCSALTGETGAGKTLVVAALGLLIGGRSRPRPGARGDPRGSGRRPLPRARDSRRRRGARGQGIIEDPHPRGRSRDRDGTHASPPTEGGAHGSTAGWSPSPRCPSSVSASSRSPVSTRHRASAPPRASGCCSTASPDPTRWPPRRAWPKPCGPRREQSGNSRSSNRTSASESASSISSVTRSTRSPAPSFVKGSLPSHRGGVALEHAESIALALEGAGQALRGEGGAGETLDSAIETSIRQRDVIQASRSSLDGSKRPRSRWPM